MIPISDLISLLRDRNARRIALQFPAGLKREAYAVASALKEQGFEPLISGDPCYGACDLANDLLPYADILVHFGHTPLNATEKILFELIPRDFALNALETALPFFTEKRIGLVTTAQHAHLVMAMVEWLGKNGFEAVVVEGSPRTPLPGQVLGCSFESARRTGATEILYVGTGLFHPLGVQLATKARVIALDPFSREIQVVDASHLLRRRFAMIEKARKAKTIGVIVSLKRGQQRWDLARRLIALSNRAVLIVMHDITPDELLNLGMECYVNTACPRLVYDDQSQFPAPLLTPSEFEIVCGVRSWDEYQIDEIGSQ
ncbi:MAG: diphthamide biosynthesis enzyme Dph2 [Methanomicrobiales archaeon]|nr:diphthamide biosynthesis enzyme Dph2 [Methanomicrobiales archaeon]